MCKKCGVTRCNCEKRVVNQYGPAGRPGAPGRNAQNVSIIVTDGTTIVSNVKKIIFGDSNAKVTDLGGGIAKVNFIPAATVWKDVANLGWYSTSGVNSFKPQYTVEGNKITFRGLLYIPLSFAASPVGLTTANSYLSVASAILDETNVLAISNANTNNGTQQGRAMTTDVGTKKNVSDIPQNRDIQFNSVPCYRRYVSGSKVTILRSFVNIRIASTSTPYLVGGVAPTGCILVFSPFNEEYDGSGDPPLGNDPQALGISRITADHNALDYVNNLDNYPWTVADSGNTNPFDCNAHDIRGLGGFIINLEGLFGYLN